MSIIDFELLLVLCGFAFLVVKSINGGGNSTNSLVRTETSTLLKAFCCVIIVCHHFALRTETGGIVRRLFAMGGGTYALVVFLFLSSYGVAKSDMKRPLSLFFFFQKRIWKLLKPYLLVTLSFIFVYSLVGAYAPTEELASFRVSQAFVELGLHLASFMDCVCYVVGKQSL